MIFILDFSKNAYNVGLDTDSHPTHSYENLTGKKYLIYYEQRTY